MTLAEMMAEVLATRRETTRALELMAQAVEASLVGLLVAMVGTGAVPGVLKGPVLIRTF
jgi:hypothetical protein